VRLFIFDTETTSLKPGRICQLSYLICENGSVKGKNMFFTVNEMSPSSQAVHGFSMEMLEELSEGIAFEDRAEEILRDLSSCDMMVGHNVAFDERFLRAETERTGLMWPKVASFCTMKYFTGNMMMKRKFQAYRPKPPKLIELKEYFGIADEEVEETARTCFGGGGAAHDARFDTAMTYLCLKKASEMGMVKELL